jgi:hypothetical protein
MTFVRLVYEDGTRTQLTEVEIHPQGPATVTIPSIDNGTVSRAEVADESGELFSSTPINLFLRVTDSLRITMLDPRTIDRRKTRLVDQEADRAVVEADAAEMRDKLWAMADRLHRQQQVLLRDASRDRDWVGRGYQNMPTGDYL